MNGFAANLILIESHMSLEKSLKSVF